MDSEFGSLTILQWLSPSFPIGAFAYSHGMEWAISSGLIRDAASVKHWLEDLLRHGSMRTDAILLARAAKGEAPQQVHELALSLAPSAERHIEAMDQGAAFSRVMRDVWGHPNQGELVFVAALGAAIRQEKLGVEFAVKAYLHAVVANLCSVAQRLVPTGQTDSQKIQRALFPLIIETATEAMNASEADLFSATFFSDISSMKHATQSPRIFKS
jgi:urease accessory protein